MIIIKLQGGLGNQLLQYSIGYVLAKQYAKNVAYDLSFFEQDTKFTKRPYLLDNFKVSVRVATQEEIESARYPVPIFSRGYKTILRIINKFIFKKYNIGYNPTFLSSVAKQKNAFFEGFWQSYKYYNENLQELSSEITLKDESLLVDFKNKFSFDATISTSVHIRRGDFLNKNAGTKIIEKKYYEHAVQLFEQKIENPTYYIFSDDIEWVEQEMGGLFKNVVYVSKYKLPDYVEFALLKECQHAILSNSTFCWFATLLTNYEGKVVLYPKDWKNAYLNRDTNICPPNWAGVE